MNPACAGVREHLSRHLDGDLSGEARASVLEHLESCAACRSELELLRLTVAALRRLPDLPPPAGILAGVRGRIAPRPWYRRLPVRLGRGWLVGVPLGAIASLLVVIGVAFFQAHFPGLKRTVSETPPPSLVTPAPPPAPPPAPAPASTPPSAPTPAPPARVKAPAAARTPPTRASRGDTAPQAARKTAVPVRAPRAAPEAASPEAVRDTAPAERFEAVPRTGAIVGRTSADGLAKRESIDRYRPRAAAVAPEAPSAEISRRQPATDQEASSYRAPASQPRPRVAATPTPLTAARSVATKKTAAANEAQPAEDEVLALYSRDGDDIEELRRLLRREGGRMTRARTMSSSLSREAIRPLRRQLPASRDVTRAWEIGATVPRRNLGRFMDAVQGRPGYQVLQRRPAGREAAGQAEHQNIRIQLFR